MNYTLIDAQRYRRYERINVIGRSGSGKSTFWRELANILRLRYYEMNRFQWKPNRQVASYDAFLRDVENVTSQQQWEPRRC